MFVTTDLQDYLAAALKKRGLATQPYWNLNFHPSLTESAQNSTHLMMRWSKKEIPDALIVTDDNLVEPVVAGLVDAGVKVPDDVELVTYCNFPAVTRSILPAKRLGCDCNELMRRCIEIIDMQRHGEVPPPMTSVSARFENEIETVGLDGNLVR